MERTYKYLHFIKNSIFFLWDPKRLSLSALKYRYNTIPLKDVLSVPKMEWIDIEDDKDYPILGVHAQGEGVYINRIAKGKELTMKQYQRSKPMHLFYCKVRTVNGQWGIVYPEFSNSYGSSNMQYLSINQEKLNPSFLELLLRVKSITQEWDKNAVGADGRHFPLKTLLNLQIPLPSLEEQNKIVQQYFDNIKHAQKIETEATKVEDAMRKWLMDNLGISFNQEVNGHYKLQFIRYKSLEKWSIDEIKRYDKYAFNNAKYEIVKLGDIITSFEGGKTPSTNCKEYWGDAVYWVSAKDMKELYLSNIQDKLSQKGVAETNMKVYPQGTILGVFRSGILRHSFPVCITAHPVTINQDLKAFGIDEEKVNKLYFLFYLNLLQDIVLNVAMKKGVTVESIDSDAFMGIPFICPPLEKQNEIVNHITTLRAEQKSLQQQASELRQQAQQQFEQKIFE